MVHIAQSGKAKPRTPVDRVLAVFGAAGAGALVGLTTEALRKWNRRRSKGGGGGLVPAVYQNIYLDAARARGLPLTADDLIGEPVE